MTLRLATLSIAIAATVLCPPTASAQAPTVNGIVSLLVPVSLKGMAPDITRLRTTCSLTGARSATSSELPVTNGSYTGTMRVDLDVTVGAYSAGETATYSCYIQGYLASGKRWTTLSSSSAYPAARVAIVTPDTGSFKW
jgi:hypothetical protein